MKCNISIYLFASSFLLYSAKAKNDYDMIENEKTLDVYKEKLNELDKNKYENVHTNDKKIFNFIENKLDILNNSKFNKRSKSYVTPDNIDKKISLLNKHNNQETFNNNYQSFLYTSSLIKENKYIPVNAVRVSRILSFLDSRVNKTRNSPTNNGDLSTCREKRRGMKWHCRKKDNNKKYVCIPDRRIQLCIVNLSIVKTYTKETMKNHFIEASKRESQLLFEKNYKKYDSKFCNDLKNSFLDYGHLAMGNDMDFGGYTTKAEDKIQEVFKTAHRKESQDKIKSFRKTWWNEFRNELWEAMIYQYKNKLSNCKNIPKDELQINQWIREWHGEFVLERNKRLELPKSKCNNNKLYEACEKVCIDPCMEYKDWIINSEFEWNTLSKEYDTQNVSNKNAENYLSKFADSKNNAKVSLLFKSCDDEYSKYCDCKHTTTLVKSVMNGKENTTENERQTVDLKDFTKFGCNEKSVETNKKVWECKKPDTSSSKVVCVPPRRQELCLGNIDRIYDKNLLMIKEHILAIAIYESRLLKRKYENKGNDKVCNVIKKSFADLKDIIKGTDDWNDLSHRKLVGKINTNSNYVHRNMANDKHFRDGWWEKIKNDAWSVMRWVFNDKTVCKENDIENIPQFFRWFSEWGDDYCEDKIKMIDTLKVPCQEKGCEDNNCKSKCNSYKEWISKQKDQYNEQVKKYKGYQTGNNYKIYPEIQSMNPEDYLKKYSKKCSNIKFETEFNETFPSEYKDKCTICSKVNNVSIPVVSNGPKEPEKVVPEIKSTIDSSSINNSSGTVERDTSKSLTYPNKDNLGSSSNEHKEVTRDREPETPEHKKLETPKELPNEQHKMEQEKSKDLLQEKLKETMDAGGLEETRLPGSENDDSEQTLKTSSDIETNGESEREQSTLEGNVSDGQSQKTQEFSSSTSVKNHLSDNPVLRENNKETNNAPKESIESTLQEEIKSTAQEVNSSITEEPERNDLDAQGVGTLKDTTLSNDTSRNEHDDQRTSENQGLEETVVITEPNNVITDPDKDHKNVDTQGDKGPSVVSDLVSGSVSNEPKELKDINPKDMPESPIMNHGTDGSQIGIKGVSEGTSNIRSENSTVNTEMPIVDGINEGDDVRTEDKGVNKDDINNENVVGDGKGNDLQAGSNSNPERVSSSDENHSEVENKQMEHKDLKKEADEEKEIKVTTTQDINGLENNERSEASSSINTIQNSGESIDRNVEKALSDTLESSSSSPDGRISNEKLSEDIVNSDQNDTNPSGRLPNMEEGSTGTVTDSKSTVTSKGNEDTVLKKTADREPNTSTVKKGLENDKESLNQRGPFNILDANSEEINKYGREKDRMLDNDLENTNKNKEPLRDVKEKAIDNGAKENEPHTNGHNVKTVDKNGHVLHLKDMKRSEKESVQIPTQNISIGQKKNLQEHKFNTRNNIQEHGSPEKNQNTPGFHGRRNDMVNHSNSVLSAGSNVSNLNNTQGSYNLNDQKLNLELYEKRDVITTRKEIKESADRNKCENEISAKYCAHMVDEKIPSKICSKEKTRNMCCAVSDYCMRYFTYGSEEYYNCTKKEFEDPSYICFRKEAFSSMPYYAGAGVLFIILIILGSLQAKDQSSEGVMDENNGNNFSFEVTDNLDKLSNMFNQQVQETNINDFSEYNEDINAY
ncbi:erythrocyte binding antigen-175 [Plasmodium sp. gorilla clade G3]|nr:erythrocyte binding antigen-175 [Plasmodium sp. gorilla clade G3]